MAKLEASLPKKQQDEIDKIESTEPEERPEAKVELKVVPDLKKEAEIFLGGANALMQRFESFVSKLESFGATDESKVLLEKAKAKHQEFSVLMEEFKKQAELHEKRTKLDENVKELHLDFNRAKDNEKQKAALRGKIEQAEEALYQAKKPAEVNLSAHEKAIAELEMESEKIGGEFKSGETVKWKSEKGEELAGEIVGPAERIGSIIVKTEKNPGGFAIQKGKLEKFVKTIEERPFDATQGDITERDDTKKEKSEAAELIGGAQDFESLAQAIEKIGEIKGMDGKVYGAEILKQIIQDISKHLPENHSPLVNLITRNEGLRDKVRELLQNKRLEIKRNDFADKDVKLNREYGTVTGWLKRALSSTNYLEAKVARDEAYEIYGKERAEAVLANVEKMMGEQIKLADSRAEAFNDAKGWGARAYDVYKNNPLFKKFNRARLITNIGLMGAGFVIGAPAIAATLGGGYIAWQVLGRGLGGVASTISSYDMMSMIARNKGTKVLSKGQEGELQQYSDEQGLSKFKRFFNRKVKVGDREVGARDLYEQKKLELETKQAKSLSNERLDELIEYYEAVVAADGKKPSEDPKYLMLMREKAIRFKKALGGENEAVKDIVEGDAFDEIKQAEKIKLTDYLKQKFLVETVLFEKMRTATGDATARKNSKEYQGWSAGQIKLQKQYEALTPELQILVDRFIQSHKQPVMEMLNPKNSDELKGIKAGEVDEAGVWAADWKFNPVLTDEIEELLNQNEVLSQMAAEAGEGEMKKFVSAVEGRDQKVEQKTAALLRFCEKGIKEAQEMIDNKRTEKGYSAVAWKKARQAMAVLIGVGMGSGFIQKHIMEFLAPSVSAEILPASGKGGVIAHVSEAGGGVESEGLINLDKLEKAGVLRPDWQKHISYDVVKDPSKVQSVIMARAREIFLIEKALDQAQAAGNAKEFKLLQGVLDQKIAKAESLYGNVFSEPPKLEAPVEVVSEKPALTVEEPKAPMKAADIEPAKAPKVIERPKVGRVIDAKPASTVEEMKTGKPEIVESSVIMGGGQDELIKAGVLKKGFWSEVKPSVLKGEVGYHRSQILASAQNIYSTEQALLRAKEIGDVKGFRLLQESLEKDIAAVEAKYGNIFEEPPKIEPPVEVPTAATTEAVSKPAIKDVKYDAASEHKIITSGEVSVDAQGLVKAGVLKEDWHKFVQSKIQNPSMLTTVVEGRARSILLTERALIDAKEAGDLKSFNALQAKLDKQIFLAEKNLGKIFEKPLTIEPPVGTIQPEAEVVVERPRGAMRVADVESGKTAERAIEVKTTAKVIEKIDKPEIEKPVAPKVAEQVGKVKVEHPRVEETVERIETAEPDHDFDERATEAELDEIAKKYGTGSAVSHRADDAFAEMDDKPTSGYKPLQPHTARPRIIETTDEAPKPRGGRVQVEDVETKQYGDRVKFRNGRLSIKEDQISTDRLPTRPRITPEDLKIQKEDPDPLWKKLLGSKHKDEFHYHKPKISLHEEALHSRARLLPELKTALEQAEEAGDKDAAYAIRQEMNKIMNSMGGRNRGSFRP